jgi:hypothetical protein
MDESVQQDAMTDDAIRTRTPVHLWIIGVLALLWNAVGCYDYLMTRMRNTDYLASMMPDVDPNAMLAWVDAFPIWAQFGWGLGVWMGLAGAVLLLLRHRWAMWAFGLSFIGAILGLGYQIVAAPPPPGAGDPVMDVMPYVIIAIAAALLIYARRQVAKGVLR